eukprot:Ihof_evm2s484 gene=Ihof_evmTU2s484
MRVTNERLYESAQLLQKVSRLIEDQNEKAFALDYELSENTKEIVTVSNTCEILARPFNDDLKASIKKPSSTNEGAEKAKATWGKLATTVKATKAFCENTALARNPWLFYPNTLSYTIWHTIQVMVAFYYAFAVPVRFGFGWENTHSLFFMVGDALCDTFLLANIYVQLSSSYVEMGIIYDDWISIRRNYMKKHVLFDILTVAPWDRLLYLITIELGCNIPPSAPQGATMTDLITGQSSLANISMGILYLPVSIVWYRGLKLLRVRDVQVCCQTIANYTSYVNTVELSKLFLSVLLAGHLCGCGYYSVVEMEGFSGNDWLPGEEFRHMMVWRQVLMSSYWGFSALTDTLSTSNPPVTILEIAFSFVIGCVSISIYAHTIGNVGKVIKTVNGASERFRTQSERINSYMVYRKIPAHIQVRVRQYFEYLHSRQQGYDDEHILRDFPAHLKLEVYRHLCKDIVKKVPLFKTRSQAFIDTMIVLLKPRIYSPGEYIVFVDEPGREMFFISVGSVKVIDRHKKHIVDLTVGDFFGEIAVVTPNSTRTASVIAITFCDVFVLDKKDLDLILHEFPDDANEIAQVARQRLRNRHEDQLSHAALTASSMLEKLNDRSSLFDLSSSVNKEEHEHVPVVGLDRVSLEQ